MSTEHTWSVEFAESLLRDAGYIVNHSSVLKKFDFNYAPKFSMHIKNPATGKITDIPIEGTRVASSSLREFLDNPVALGGMRVRQ